MDKIKNLKMKNTNSEDIFSIYTEYVKNEISKDLYRVYEEEPRLTDTEEPWVFRLGRS